MNSIDTQVQAIEKMVAEHLPGESPYFLVEIRIKPTNNVKVFIDGDQGITIERCVAINRALYKQLETSALFPDGDFSLEVSSPGLDEPLKSYRQYIKNTGRPVEVLLKDGTKKEGILKAVDPNSINIEETIGKKAHGRLPGKTVDVVMHNFSFDNIKSTKVQIKF